MAVKHRITNVSSDGLDLQERVVDINRVAKVVKGGRRFSFTALVVVGDEQSIVGIGYGKANEVPIAIQKGVEQAKKSLFQVPKYKSTITHKTLGRFGAGQVMLKPASAGTGVIAGGGVRAVLELAGVHDILAKSLGSQNPINLVKATVDALQSLRRPEDVAKARGLSIHEVLGIEKPAPKHIEDEIAAATEGEASPPAAASEPVPAIQPVPDAAHTSDEDGPPAETADGLSPADVPSSDTPDLPPSSTVPPDTALDAAVEPPPDAPNAAESSATPDDEPSPDSAHTSDEDGPPAPAGDGSSPDVVPGSDA